MTPSSIIQTTKAWFASFQESLQHKKNQHKHKVEDWTPSHIETKKKQHHEETQVIEPLDPWKFWITGLLVIGLGALIRNAASIVYLVITAFIVSMAVDSMIMYFNQWMGRGFSIGLAYFLVVIFILSGIVLVVPLVAGQVADLLGVFIERLGGWQGAIQEQGLAGVVSGSKLPDTIRVPLVETLGEQSRGMALQENLTENMGQIVSVGSSSIGDVSSFVVSAITSIFSTFAQAAIVIVMAVFFSLEKSRVIGCIASMASHTQKLEEVLHRLYHKLGSRLRGQLILCLSIGVMAGLGLVVLGWFGFEIPNILSLALIAGLTEFIPYVGPLIGMLPALLLAMTEYGLTGFGVVFVLYIGIQQLEGNVLVPMVMYHTLGVSPLLILLSMIVGGSLFGFLGVLLAVPIAVIINILYQSYSGSRGEEYRA